MADSIYVAALLYMNVVPGGCSMGHARKALTQLSRSTIVHVGSLALPTDMVSRSFTCNAAKCSPTSGGKSCGKNDTTRSSTRSFPSATARPTAVEVKLLLREYNARLKSG